ncbi:MAG: hypothetical protein LBR34_00405 [Prevotella sp.]|nr:hypothetical protein [Prevotella sp.]
MHQLLKDICLFSYLLTFFKSFLMMIKQKFNRRIVWTTLTSFLLITSLLCVECRAQSFTSSDWERVKLAYNQWRKKEIRKGNYAERCMTLEELAKEETDTDLIPRYALPAIPAKIKKAQFDDCSIDTLRADINCDGKMDVLFRIYPWDNEHGTGSARHPLIYATFVSKNGNYIFDNKHVDKTIKKIWTFAKNYPDDTWDDWEWTEIDKISVKDGRVIIQGHSEMHISSDASCCPSVRFDFTSYTYQSGKGYMDIKWAFEKTFTPNRRLFPKRLTIQ